MALSWVPSQLPSFEGFISLFSGYDELLQIGLFTVTISEWSRDLRRFSCSFLASVLLTRVPACMYIRKKKALRNYKRWIHVLWFFESWHCKSTYSKIIGTGDCGEYILASGLTLSWKIMLRLLLSPSATKLCSLFQAPERIH